MPLSCFFIFLFPAYTGISNNSGKSWSFIQQGKSAAICVPSLYKEGAAATKQPFWFFLPQSDKKIVEERREDEEKKSLPIFCFKNCFTIINAIILLFFKASHTALTTTTTRALFFLCEHTVTQ